MSNCETRRQVGVTAKKMLPQCNCESRRQVGVTPRRADNQAAKSWASPIQPVHATEAVSPGWFDVPDGDK